MSLLIVLVGLAAAASISVAGVLGGLARPWVIVAVSVLAAIEAVAVRPLVDIPDTPVRRVRQTELALALLTVPALASVPIGDPPAWFAGEVLSGWAVTVITWILSQATLDDLDRIRRGLGAVEGHGPLTRLRIRLFGVVTVATVAAAAGSVGWQGLFDLERAAVRVMSVGPWVLVGVGIPALGWASYAEHRARWTGDGTVVDGEVGRRWIGAIASVTAGAMAVAVAIPSWSMGITAVPVRLLANAGPVGTWLVDVFDRIGSVGGEPLLDEGSTAGGEIISELGETGSRFPEWGGEVALVVFVLFVFGYVIVRARQATLTVRESPPGGVDWRALWRVMAEWLADLVRAVARAISRSLRWAQWRRERQREAPAGDQGRRALRPRLPEDPERARIVLAHRRFVDAAGARIGPRIRAETAAEFAERVRPAVSWPPPIDRLTGLYHEARYSLHPLDGEDAELAERSAQALIADLDDERSG